MGLSGFREKRAWIFQGNPKSYRLYDSLLDENLKGARWLVKRYKDEILLGDLALIWKARDRSGIYAVGTVVSNPQIMPDSEESLKYWVEKSEGEKPSLRIDIHYLHRFNLLNSLKRAELKMIPQLKNMEVLCQPEGTNFKVTDVEWSHISNLLDKRYGLSL